MNFSQVINTHEANSLSDDYPHAYFYITIPTMQNVQNISLQYVRIDGRINNVNEWNNWFWLDYPLATNPNDRWQEITIEPGFYDDETKIVNAINDAISNSVYPAGAINRYTCSLQDNGKFAFTITKDPLSPPLPLDSGGFDFENSSLRYLLGYKSQAYSVGNVAISSSVTAELSPDLFASFKEIYLLCGIGNNVSFDVLWREGNSKNVIAILPLVWSTADKQDNGFIFTGQSLQYLCPQIFETPNSLKNIDFQFIFKDTLGFHLLPQENSLAGNTIIVTYNISTMN